MRTDTIAAEHSGDSVHDEEYYFDDGDCIFQVDGTLFKIHRWPLCRDQSVFRDMFSLPAPKLASANEQQVIPMPTDTVDDFRALCWAIYAPPGEIYLQGSECADVQRLLRVAKMTHKYILPQFESWALKMLDVHHERLLAHLHTCTEDILERTLDLAVVSNNIKLLNMADTVYISRVQRGEIPCHRALKIGEEHGRRTLQGGVYLWLRKRIEAPILLSPKNGGFAHLNLTDYQLQRLLSGHVMLNSALYHIWTQRFSTPGTQHLVTCTDHPGCGRIWENKVAWNFCEPMASLERAQAVGKESPCIADYLDRFGLRNDAVDYFLGPDESGTEMAEASSISMS
ncbi:hypothetical protein C8F01DRAFT_1112346 [Mycena amicta]|nr:hypothetical protein C8F01DRAFT_1112346 [Mycena amicta]